MNRSHPHRSDSGGYRGRQRRRNHQAAATEPSATQEILDHPSVSKAPPIWIETDEALQTFITHVRSLGQCAYDTEFIGEETYWPQLCLIQLATVDQVALIDVMADIDCTPIWQLIADPDVEVIVHAGGQDIEPVLRHLKSPPANVFDTQIAAGFIGLPYPLSLSRLAKTLLGVVLPKGLTYTSWDARPLSNQHAKYAADDVRYGLAIAQQIKDKLTEIGHVDWTTQACFDQCQPERFTFNAVTQSKKIKGWRSLKPRQYTRLIELIKVRDQQARQQNRPVRTIWRDEWLLNWAKRPPQSDRPSTDVPKKIGEKWGQLIVATLEPIDDQSPDQLIAVKVTSPTDRSPADQFASDYFWTKIQHACYERSIDPSLLVNRQQALNLYDAQRQDQDHWPSEIADWRAEVLKAIL